MFRLSGPLAVSFDLILLALLAMSLEPGDASGEGNGVAEGDELTDTPCKGKYIGNPNGGNIP
jgi:hypothetical protein